MRHTTASVSSMCVLLLSCGSNTKESHRGLYESQDGTQILAISKGRVYLGTKDLPPGADAIADYGTPVRRVSGDDLTCVVVSQFTFAISSRPSFSCNGISFDVRAKPAGSIVIRATCGSLRKGLIREGACAPAGANPPAFQYEYGYIPGVGVEWVRILPKEPNEPSDGKDIIRHRRGLRILEPAQ